MPRIFSPACYARFRLLAFSLGRCLDLRPAQRAAGEGFVRCRSHELLLSHYRSVNASGAAPTTPYLSSTRLLTDFRNSLPLRGSNPQVTEEGHARLVAINHVNQRRRPLCHPGDLPHTFCTGNNSLITFQNVNYNIQVSVCSYYR